MIGTRAALIVGPADVLGAHPVEAELITAAIEFVDDGVTVVDERVVPVAAVWRDVMAAAVDPETHTVALVCPSWWRSSRTGVVCDAARLVASKVILLRRVDILRRADTFRTGHARLIVEFADDFVVIHDPAAGQAVIPRVGEPRAVIDGITSRIDESDAVLIDVPTGMAGAKELAAELAGTLRLRGVAVSVADDQRVLRAAEAHLVPRRRWAGARRAGELAGRLGHPRVAAVACSGLVVALAGAAAGYGSDDSAATASTWLVEGRVAVEVPADWPAERIDSGPGSARVQVVSPSEPHDAIQLTQSQGQASLAEAADALRRALDEQPDGVFVDFTAADRRAEKPAITYREIRAEHHVDWTVLLDRGVRIAIGCQHAPDRPAPERVCDQAIRSARALA
jgi:type VII secretion-associated protein (TIGR03931 family)